MANVERTVEVVWSGTIARGAGMAPEAAVPSETFRSPLRHDLATPRVRPARKS